MVKDIRVGLSFPDHPKHRRLIKRLGPKATWYLLKLWTSAAERRPKGVLIGWDESDIAEAAGWPDDRDPQELVEALLGDGNRGGFLERVDGVYRLHHWQEHQGWVCGAEARSEHARKAAMAKYSSPQRMLDAYSENAQRNAPSPSPKPYPNPNPPPPPSPSPPPFPSPHPASRLKAEGLQDEDESFEEDGDDHEEDDYGESED